MIMINTTYLKAFTSYTVSGANMPFQKRSVSSLFLSVLEIQIISVLSLHSDEANMLEEGK